VGGGGELVLEWGKDSTRRVEMGSSPLVGGSRMGVGGRGDVVVGEWGVGKDSTRRIEMEPNTLVGGGGWGNGAFWPQGIE
jgi:hypothetical protein